MNYRNKIWVALLCVVALGLCGWAAKWFLSTWSMDIQSRYLCTDRRGVDHAFVNDQELYYSCVEEEGKRFLSVDYAESKDASKAFLTLLVAVLVASITFSEKIVNIRQSHWTARLLMILCWVLFLIAIGSCGAAMALMIDAAGYATYSPQSDYRVLEFRAVTLYFVSGISFGTGLAVLLISGIVSIASRSPDSNA